MAIITRIRYCHACGMNGYHDREVLPHLNDRRWTWLNPVIGWLNRKIKTRWSCRRCVRNAMKSC